MKKFLVAIATAALVTFSSSSGAFAAPVGAPNQLSQFDGASSIDSCGGPGTGYNPVNGKTLAAWTTDSGTPTSVQYTFLNEDGTPGEVFTYSNVDAGIPTLDDCAPVEIGGSSDGNFLIGWQVSNDSAIRGIVVNADGDLVEADFALSTNTNYTDIETLDIEWSAADERYLVAWKANVFNAFDGEAASQQLVGLFVESDGTQIGDDFLVTNSANSYNNSMDLAFGDGVWAVVGGNYNGSKAYVTFVEADGTLSSAFPCSAQNSNTSSASIAYNDASDVFACVWKSDSTVVGNFMDSAGSLAELNDVVMVNDSVGGKPRVKSLGADGWFVTWHTGDGGGDTPDVSGAQIDSDGVIVGEPEYLSNGLDDLAAEINFRPSVVFSPATGHVYVAWVGHDVVADSSEVYSRAWYVREGEGVPASLAETGVDAGGISLAAASLVVLGAVVARRRRA